MDGQLIRSLKFIPSVLIWF